MTDKEINDTIATGIMGWERDSSIGLFRDERGHYCADPAHWNPLIKYSDCLQAWIKFSETRRTSLNCTDGIWEACVENEEMQVLALHEDPDPLRAMCLCMIKAVEVQKVTVGLWNCP